MSDASLDKTLQGRYRLLNEVGRGATARVFRAVDETLHRLVAIKIIVPSETGLNASQLVNEARIASRLKHPNILPVLGSGEADGRSYLVTELVEGRSFAETISGGPVAPDYAVTVIAQVCGALRYAHSRGFLHGDIKPSNILISSSGRILLSDFGLAGAPGGSRLTPEGRVLGTPKYMSPEQAMGRPLDVRSDLYSLAVVLYEALAGTTWFEGWSPATTLERVVEQAPPPIRDEHPDVPEFLARVLAKALAKNPADRYQDADDFLRALLAGVPSAAARFSPRSSGLPGPEREKHSLQRARASPGLMLRLAGFAVVAGLLSWLRAAVDPGSARMLVLPLTMLAVVVCVSLWLRARPERGNLSSLGRPAGRSEPVRRSSFGFDEDDDSEDESDGADSDESVERVTVFRSEGSAEEPSEDESTVAVMPYRHGDLPPSLPLQDPSAGSWLLVVNGPSTGRQFNLSETLTIGRTPDNAVCLADAAVSRRHAEIVLSHGRFHLRDLGSQSGTLVNGVQVTSRELRDRDELQVGATTLMFISAIDSKGEGADSKRRLDEFHHLWAELTRAAHND